MSKKISPFVKLTKEQIKHKIEFLNQYTYAQNAATGSKLDANANVSQKNIATRAAELNKDINIQINREIMYNRLNILFGSDFADEYIRQIESHEIYVHDETSPMAYCCAISLYPLLIDGLRSLGGESGPPTHLRSFTGSFVNLIYMVSSQFAGAVAAVETLMYIDHFAKKDLGENYLDASDKVKIIENELQYIFYTLNQPAAARGNQSVFFNLTVYDENYFNALFESFYFPDGSKPEWESIKKLQMFFLRWLRNERKRAILTFPVVTAALLIDKTGKCVDTEFMEFLSEELSLGNSFFVYMSDSADSLSSCCRLRNENNDNTFSHSMGAGGVSTGSINVITVNLNRLIQDIANGKRTNIEEEITKVIKYQVAYRKNIEEDLNAGMLPVYDAGYISLDKQFLTIGINGIVEAAEFLGITPNNNVKYINWCKDILKEIDFAVKQGHKNFGYKFNVEFVPAENLGVKNSEWDKKDGYTVNHDCYNSYFYVVEDEQTTDIDKFIMHGRDVTKYLSGGSALHLNLSAYPTKESAIKLFELAGKTGCNYWCTNILITYCETCHNIDLNTLHQCPKCQSRDISHATRVIGYLKKIKNFSKARQKEAAIRVYH